MRAHKASRETNQSIKVKLHPAFNFAFLRLNLEVNASENASGILEKMCINKRVAMNAYTVWISIK